MNYSYLLLIIVGINISATGILLYSVFRWRYLALKPSVMYIAYYQISVMWPAVTWLQYILDVVGDVGAYLVAIHVYGLLATVIGVLCWRKAAFRLGRTIEASARQQIAVPMRLWSAFLWCILGCVVIWYLRVVGIKGTGLYVMITGGEESAQAREKALKLLDNGALRYAWWIVTCSVAYVLGYLLAMRAIESWRRSRFASVTLCAIGYGLVLLAVMIPGARGPAAMVVLTTLFGYYLSTGFRLPIGKILVVLGLALVLPAILSLLREGQTISISQLSVYYLDIFDRVAGRSIEDNIWMVAYPQKNGFFGPGGIPALGHIIGAETVNIFNVVGLYFRPDGIESISANASYVAVNYACFGVGSLPISLLLVLLMDSTLLLHKGLPRKLVAPSVGVTAIIAMNFAMTMYTTVFLTHGLLYSIGLCHVLGSLWRRRKKEQGETQVVCI